MMRDTCKEFTDRWYYRLVPAILKLAEETKLKSISNDSSLYGKGYTVMYECSEFYSYRAC